MKPNRTLKHILNQTFPTTLPPHLLKRFTTRPRTRTQHKRFNSKNTSKEAESAEKGKISRGPQNKNEKIFSADEQAKQRELAGKMFSEERGTEYTNVFRSEYMEGRSFVQMIGNAVYGKRKSVTGIASFFGLYTAVSATSGNMMISGAVSAGLFGYFVAKDVYSVREEVLYKRSLERGAFGWDSVKDSVVENGKMLKMPILSLNLMVFGASMVSTFFNTFMTVMSTDGYYVNRAMKNPNTLARMVSASVVSKNRTFFTAFIPILFVAMYHGSVLLRRFDMYYIDNREPSLDNVILSEGETRDLALYKMEDYYNFKLERYTTFGHVFFGSFILATAVCINNLPSSSGRFIRRGVHKAATSWAKKL